MQESLQDVYSIATVLEWINRLVISVGFPKEHRAVLSCAPPLNCVTDECPPPGLGYTTQSLSSFCDNGTLHYQKCHW